jgi:hypothetical protein
MRTLAVLRPVPTIYQDEESGIVINDYKFVRAWDGDFASPMVLEPFVEELVNRVIELNAAMDAVASVDPNRRIVVEMQPTAFRQLIIAARVHYPAHMFFTSKPGEFEIYNVIFRAVPPPRKQYDNRPTAPERPGQGHQHAEYPDPDKPA